MAKTTAKSSTPTTRNTKAAIIEAIAEYFDSSEVEVFNGGTMLVKKPVLLAITEISKGVKKLQDRQELIGVELAENTKQTKENSGLLETERQKKIAVTNLISLVKSLSWWQKALVILIAVHYLGMFIESTSGAKLWSSAIDAITKLF